MKLDMLDERSADVFMHMFDKANAEMLAIEAAIHSSEDADVIAEKLNIKLDDQVEPMDPLSEDKAAAEKESETHNEKKAMMIVNALNERIAEELDDNG